MRLELKRNLPFITVTIAYQGKVIEIPNVLIDTGSATSIFSADRLTDIDLIPAPEDILFTIRGVGGTEVVFARKVDYLKVGEKKLPDFQIEVGGMDYGFELFGILGMDFLTQSQSVIDLGKMEIGYSE